MSVSAPEVNQRLAAITEAGTSVWLDQMRRSLVQTGELARMVREDSLRGVTSNPAIFEKAILGSPDYDEHLEELAREGASGREVYRALVVRDVQMAADVLRPVWEQTSGRDGFVSLEVAPRLAHDTDGTIEQARSYWGLVDRPNAMIKIPGTVEGLPAIEEMIFEGVNVNVTLLFSVESYAAVCEAFIRALERRREDGRSLEVQSVASFFVSRVDSEVDKRLEALGNTELQGTAALANARAAYAHFTGVFRGERFAELAAAGAPVQRPLWASTGVKNPHYSETLYVDNLLAPDTVNTMPMPTLLAVGERGEPRPGSAQEDPAEALRKLADAGIDMGDVTKTLLEEGIEKFVEPMEKLLAGIESRREAVVTGRPPAIEAEMPDGLEPAITAAVARATDEDVARRVWRKDQTLWGGPGPEIGDRLGWLQISEAMLEDLDHLTGFAREAADDGLRDAVLLGMGGSSLAPEVLGRSFGTAQGALSLHVLDSTDAAAIRAVEERIDPERTLFLVSTKSGGTIETLSLFAHFHAVVADAVGADQAGSRFAAITDPGSSLVDLACEHGFRHTFVNDPNIGGRYSALSYVGLVPAALIGADLVRLLDGAQVAEQACAHHESSAANSGLWLGVTLGALAREGRDKLTFVVDEPLGSFGLWAEQLVAESTGKHGRGILPVADEPLGSPEAYGDDRVFVHLRHADEPHEAAQEKLKALADAGHPVLTLNAGGPEDLGRIFFFAEFATAVAGWALDLNPFDQPNVQEAKDNTNQVLDGYREKGELPDAPDADSQALRALLSAAEPGRYVAIMGYVAPSEAFDAAIAKLRAAIRDATRATTTFGYGPRFLHSTGQFHKGGPETGIFLQLIHDGPDDVEIPGQPFGFTTLKNAQAIGDLDTLRSHGLAAERVRLRGADPAAALEDLTTEIKEIL